MEPFPIFGDGAYYVPAKRDVLADIESGNVEVVVQFAQDFVRKVSLDYMMDLCEHAVKCNNTDMYIALRYAIYVMCSEVNARYVKKCALARTTF